MTDPKPYTENDPNECFRDLSNHNDSRFLATAQAAAEADSLRAQLEEAEKRWADHYAGLLIAATSHEAALTTARGEVAVLRDAGERLSDAINAQQAGRTTQYMVDLSDATTVLRAALTSTRATADAHDERVRREALEDFATRLLTTSALPEFHAGHVDAARWARALAHPTKEPT